MTARQLYESVLIEINNENSPNILLEDFNYFANRAIYQFVNKRYNIYDINQQTTDDLRVLKGTATLIPKRLSAYDSMSLVDGGMAVYYVDLPSDYLHLLNCICVYNVKKTYKCYNAGDTWRSAAKRLTSDSYSQIIDNFWNKPSYKNPYYFIHNMTTNASLAPTNPYEEDTQFGTDVVVPFPVDYNNCKILNNETGEYIEELKYTSNNVLLFINGANVVILLCCDGYKLVYNKETKTIEISEEQKPMSAPNVEGTLSDGIYTFTIDGTTYKFYSSEKKAISANSETDSFGNPIINIPNGMFSSNYDSGLSNIQKTSKVRYGNASKVRLEIRYGTDNSIFTLDTIPGMKGGKIYIDYIKAPLHIRLTQSELDHTEDTSQVLEFPDYVCQEIINELVHIIMENSSNQRLSTHPVVSLSIANPAQALAPEAAGQSAQ